MDSLTGATKEWPTPRTITGGAESAERKKELGRKDSGGGDLQAATQAWQTPSAGLFGTRGNDRVDEPGLKTQAQNWPTAKGQDAKHGEATEYELKRPEEHDLLHVRVSRQWVTPATRDYKGANGPEHLINGTGRKHLDQLPNQVAFLSGRLDPQTSPAGEPSSPSDPTSPPRLNPMFVEWLMGLPIGWTDYAPVATESFRSWRASRSGLLRRLLGFESTEPPCPEMTQVTLQCEEKGDAPMFEPAKKVRKFVKVCLWGGPKVGKTEFALSFPKPCVVDSEKGSLLFADRAKFSVKEVTRWKDLGPVISWIRAHPDTFETLVIDSLTPLYKDLIDEVLAAAQNKNPSLDKLHQAGWGVVKRRFAAFLKVLTELPVNVVLTIRSKDEYETVKDRKGDEQHVKTGQDTPDIDKMVDYIFDFIVSCKVEVDKKTKKVVRHLATVEGSRRPELMRGEVFDVTGKKGFEVVFATVAKILSEGATVAQTTATDEISGDQQGSADISGDQRADRADHAAAPAPMTHEEATEEIDAFFGARTPGVPCTPEDLKVLFTRAGEVKWPDGRKFSKEDAKSLIKFCYGVESGKELFKHEVDFLFDEFGKVLARRALLVLEKGNVIIATPIEMS